MIRPISALGSAGGLRAAAPACLQLGRAGTGAAGTCLLGEEVDLSSHVLGNAKLEAVGVARRGQDVPVVGDPRHPLDLEAGNTRGAFVGPTLHPGNRWEPTGALIHRAGTQRGPASTEGWFGGLWGAAPLCYCERRPGTASSELPATHKTKNPQPAALGNELRGSQRLLTVLQALAQTPRLSPHAPTPAPCRRDRVLLALPPPPATGALGDGAVPSPRAVPCSCGAALPRTEPGGSRQRRARLCPGSPSTSLV